MNLSKSYEFFQPEKLRHRVHIIGCGAGGSTLAENLARFGITKISLYDFDTVDEHNIANQMYTSLDIGKKKVHALADMLTEINPDIQNGIKIFEEGYIDQKLSGYVFLCVDNIDLRRRIATSMVGNTSIKAMFDFRMRLTDAQHYAAAWDDAKMVEAFLNSMQFSHEEAMESTPMSGCNLTLSVCPTVRMLTALGVANFINFVNGGELKKMIVFDAFQFDFVAL